VFYRMYQTFYLSFNDWDYFYAGEILGNESFRTEIVSLFSTCLTFNFFSNCYKEVTEGIGHVPLIL